MTELIKKVPTAFDGLNGLKSTGAFENSLATATGNADPDAHVAHPPRPFDESAGHPAHPLLLSSPHSGRFYPAELFDQTSATLQHLRRLEDPLMDIIIAPAAAQGIATITGNYARAWIDLNRRETEVDPRQLSPRPTAHSDHHSPRVAAGLGLIPRSAGDGRSIYARPLALETLTNRIAAIHRPYHQRIAARLATMRDQHGIALLCDMHSMPGLPPSQSADVVIGDRHGRTAAPWLTALVEKWLAGKGLRVSRNLPYAGGHGVERHGDTGNAVHALQLEFDRRIYLKPDGLTLSAGADDLKDIIADMAAMLCDALKWNQSHRLAAE